MRLIGTVFVVGVLLAGSLGAQQKPQEVALQAAMRTETVAGDLKAAIAKYQAIVEKYARTDRGVAATALVRMAECHHKLGEQQATRLFERVLREFGDQKEAVQIASARLGRAKAVAASAGMVNRQVWTGPTVDYMGTISNDGRALSLTDWSTGDLALRDMSSGSTRRLTNKGSWADSEDFAEFSAISRDGAHVAFAWFAAKTGRYQLRVIRSDGSPSSLRTVFDNPDVGWIAVHDWSPDGRWLAVQLTRVDRSAQIGLVSVSDGTFKALRSTDWRGTTRMFFSPDGTLIAYDLSQDEGAHARDVFVISLDGARQFAIAPHRSHDVAVGWSSDGRSVLLASDRAGSMGLWAIPVTGGQPAATPVLLKSDIGQMASSLGVTRDGALLYAVRTSAVTVATASLDLEGGRLRVPPTYPFETYLQRLGMPDWSPDGELIVALTELSRTRGGLTIRRPDGSHVRDLSPPLSYMQRPRWAPDGSITVQGADFKGRQGFYRIDSSSGEATPLLLGDDGAVSLGQVWWLPDRESIVFRRNMPGEVRVCVRNLRTGEERLLAHDPLLRGLGASADGRSISYIVRGRDRTESKVVVHALDTGEVREVVTMPAPARLLNMTQWTPDGRHLIFASTRTNDSEAALWVVPAAGGEPKQIEPVIGSGSAAISVSLHPDGRTVAYTAGENAVEVWTLEAFLPPPAATSSRR